MHLIGDYRYSSAVLNGQRFAIIRNGAVLERVRRIEPLDNPIIWQKRRHSHR